MKIKGKTLFIFVFVVLCIISCRKDDDAISEKELQSYIPKISLSDSVVVCEKGTEYELSIDIVCEKLTDYTCQWYEIANGKTAALIDEISPTLLLTATNIGSFKYFCEVKKVMPKNEIGLDFSVIYSDTMTFYCGEHFKRPVIERFSDFFNISSFDKKKGCGGAVNLLCSACDSTNKHIPLKRQWYFCSDTLRTNPIEIGLTFDSVFHISRIQDKGIYYCYCEIINSFVDKNGNKQELKIESPVISVAYTGLPTLYITLGGNKKIEDITKEDWFNVEFNLIADGIKLEYSNIHTTAKIKGRGNMTWLCYPKKPYRIKLSEKESVLGFPANKDWCLLAEHCDKSLLRTAYMCAVSNALNIDYTIRFRHIDLFLNDNYLGVYLITDFVEEAKNRVNIGKDGYLITDDNYYREEPLYFITEIDNRPYTFKYPDADDISENSDEYIYIKSFMNNLEFSLTSLAWDANSVDFLHYIDLNSFAKWYLAAEITATQDPNRYYVMTSKGSPIKMYPLWDAEWSMGLWASFAWGEAPNLVEQNRLRTAADFYYKYLFKSPLFVNEVISEWEKFKLNDNVIANINDVVNNIKYAQQLNFLKWSDNTRAQFNVQFGSWEKEVEYVNDFYFKRINELNRLLYLP